jgi:hypothetical protein
MNDLQQKTDEELKEIMRNSIENSYVPSSIYNKAKQELEFRKTERQDKPEEIIKLSPELYGVGINLKPLWKKIKSQFKK